jgi:hypothetical protein
MLGKADAVLISVSWYVVITYEHSVFFYLRKILFKLIFNFSNTVSIEEAFQKLHSGFFTEVVPMLLLVITNTDSVIFI